MPVATLSKRLEFSASHSCLVRGQSKEDAFRWYGEESLGAQGHGHNYVLWTTFQGPVDSITGMILNVSTIKEKIGMLLESRYDHKYLNKDTPPFHRSAPTVEAVAAELCDEARSLFTDETAHLIAVDLHESARRSARAAYDGGVIARYHFDFSAARRTWSPHLSEKENEELFGQSARMEGHGHHYRVAVVLAGDYNVGQGLHVPYPDVWRAISALRQELDHSNLTHHLPEFAKEPNTTESLAYIILRRLSLSLPVVAVRVHEHDRFFVDAVANGRTRMGILGNFNATHRLHAPALSDSENRVLYGKCNNAAGHGHDYLVECLIEGKMSDRTGIVMSLTKLEASLAGVVRGWHHRHLDTDIPPLAGRASTGENILAALWENMSVSLGQEPLTMRLWETPNNRFELAQSESEVHG